MTFNKNIVPYFICSKTGVISKGRGRKAVMFADISGFTSLTELLMRKGKYGSEVLSITLNRLFGHIEDAVYTNNGFIATFAGDAFTGIFENTNRAINAGLIIQDIIRQYGTVDTGSDIINLSIKIGISYGNVSWGIPGRNGIHTFFFKGKAIKSSAYCQEQCKPGDIIIDDNTYIAEKQSFRADPVNDVYRVSEQKYLKKSDKAAINICENQQLFSDMYKYIKDADNEFRQVISVFVNFKDFRTYNDMNVFIGDILETVKNCGGYFNSLDFGDKGNTMLILFGAPISKGNSIERALHFADAIRSKYKKRIRAGVTIGNVYAGFVGNRRCTYTVIGDAVNLAARLMGLAKWGKILCDDSFENQAGNIWDISKWGRTRIKGKSNNVMVYNVLSQINSKGTGKELIGRKEQIYIIKGIINDVKSGKNRGIVSIRGESGTGKTIFADYVQSVLKKDIRIIRMHCDKIFRRSLNPFSSYMRSILVNPGNPGQFNQEWENISNNIHSIKDRKAAIGDIAGIYVDDTNYHNLPPKDKYDIKLFALKDYFKHYIESPLILIIDDIDYADNDTLSVLSMITDNSGDKPYCILTTARKRTEIAGDLKNSVHTLIELGNMTNEEIRKIIQNKLKYDISDEIEDIILAKSDGNPYFAEQLITYMKDRILIENTGNIYELVDRNADIPSEISRILIARIDSLKPALKTAVKHASVLGMEFSKHVLQHMMEIESIDPLIMDGMEADIWNAINEMEILFKQGILRDTVYDMQMRKKLKELHLKAAVILRMLYSEEQEYMYKIAYHYENAGYKDDAYRYYDNASKWAVENFRNDENINILERMLELTDKNSDFSEIYLRTGDVYFYNGEMDEALKYYIDADLYGQKAGDNVRRARAQMSMSEIKRVHSDYKECIECACKAKELAENTGSDEYIVRTLLMTGSVHMTQGRMEEAKKDFLEAKELAEEIQDDAIFENVYTNLGNYYWNLGHYDDAIKSFNRAIDISEKNHSIETLCSSYGNLGGVYWYMGNMKKSQIYYEKGIEIAKQAGIKRITSMLTGNMASIYINKGDYEKAIEMLNFKIEATSEMGDKKGKAYALLNLGSIYFNKGQYDKAEELYNETLGIFKPLQIRYGLGIVLGNLGELHMVNNKIDEAMNCFMEKLALADNAGDDKMLANAYAAIGDVNMHTGNYDDAISSYTKAYELAAETGVKKSLVNTIFSIGSALRKMGKYEEAEDNLNEAMKYAKEMEGNIDECHIYNEMAKLMNDRGDIEKAVEYIEKSQKLALNIKNSNESTHSFLIKAAILATNEPDKALNIIESINTDNEVYRIETDIVRCLASRDIAVCKKIRDELEQMYEKTGNIVFNDKLTRIKNVIEDDGV